MITCTTLKKASFYHVQIVHVYSPQHSIYIQYTIYIGIRYIRYNTGCQYKSCSFYFLKCRLAVFNIYKIQNTKYLFHIYKKILLKLLPFVSPLQESFELFLILFWPQNIIRCAFCIHWSRMAWASIDALRCSQTVCHYFENALTQSTVLYILVSEWVLTIMNPIPICQDPTFTNLSQNSPGMIVAIEHFC